MTRLARLAPAALVVIGAALVIVGLGGCTANERPDRATVTAHELVGFEWCSPAQLHQCALIRQGGELKMMTGNPSRIGDPDAGDVWDVRGVTVDAFSEDE